MVFSISALAETAALVGDPARANMLAALMDGRALTATELARAAGIAPQTASGHLAKLTEAGLVAMTQQGRHRYHRLASARVAQMLEAIMGVAADLGAARNAACKSPLRVGPRDRALRRARTCYDHLAGEVAVAIADRMVERHLIDLSPDGGALTAPGERFLGALGVDLEGARARSAQRGRGQLFCCPCLDWSERRSHIAGAVGAALCQCCFAQGWFRRMDGTRAVAITPTGYAALDSVFDLRPGPPA